MQSRFFFKSFRLNILEEWKRYIEALISLERTDRLFIGENLRFDLIDLLRDLAARNVLLEMNPDFSIHRARVADFGFYLRM